MIIFFSSTGNSLTVAKGLAEALDDTYLHINQAMKLKKTNDKLIGLVYPVHNYNMPKMVQEFVKQFDFGSPDYIFGIITHGGDRGNSLATLKILLEEKGLELSYGNDILMPVNSRIMYGMVTTDIEERTGKQLQIIQNYAENIKNSANNSSLLKKKRMATMMYNLGESSFAKKFFTPSINPDLCTACGICSKVCPVDNISTGASGVKIESSCESCMTCMHWCPQVAIGFGKRKVKKEQQYHHPDVKLKDMIDSLK